MKYVTMRKKVDQRWVSSTRQMLSDFVVCLSTLRYAFTLILESPEHMKKLFFKKDIHLLSFFDVPAQEMKVVRSGPKWYQMVYEDVA